MLFRLITKMRVGVTRRLVALSVKIRHILLLVMLIGVAFVSLNPFALPLREVFGQSPPNRPMLIAGNVTVNGAPAPDGSIVLAYINGVQVGNASVANGQYSLTLVGNNGDTISFKLNNLSTNVTATFDNTSNGGVLQLNLSFTGQLIITTSVSTTLLSQSNITSQTTVAATVVSTTSSTTSAAATSNPSGTASADFSIVSSTSLVTLAAGSTGSVTITIDSLNDFNSAVTLSASWVGTAPTSVSFSIVSPVTPSLGGVASSSLILVADPNASVGTFAIRVTGTSGSLTHASPDITIQIVSAAVATTSGNTATTVMGSSTSSGTASPPSSCAVAIATFGSDLAPMVESLRTFRDRSIMKTRVGAAFMLLFNTWYYSFSPQLAHYVGSHPVDRMAFRVMLIPLIAALNIAYEAYRFVSPVNGEAGAVVAGMVSASLLGLVYVAPVLYVMKVLFRRKQAVVSKTFAISCFLAGTLMVCFSYTVGSSLLTGFSVAVLVLSSVGLGALFGVRVLSGMPLIWRSFKLVAPIKRFTVKSSFEIGFLEKK